MALGDRASAFRTLDTGWFAKKRTFGYERSDRADVADGGDGWLESTPPILMPYQARAGLQLVNEIGVSELREYSLRQQKEMRDNLREFGILPFEPETPDHFGAFSLVRHAKAAEYCERLRSVGVNTDARGEFVRFGPDLLNSSHELKRAAEMASRAL